ncbi:kinase-like domain-containing protein [Zopfochytrium polystomum]|nr:kinase-like domain-containing protein [Zopfochytrium polystomum]
MACEDHDRQCQLQQQTLLEGLTIPSHHVDVDRTQALGRGSFGVAFRATYISTQVAVKELLTPALSAKVREELAREVSALKNSHHPNIIRFYGLIKDSQSGLMSIVIEYASLGSLFDFYLATPKSEVPLDSRIHLLFQTAAGLCYLHDVLHILHRDVKSPNVLLSRDTETQGLVAKISDFGLATLKNESAILSQDVKPVGTLLWMAPETVDALASKTTRKSDVFAFAVLMTEVLGWVGVYGLPWQSMPRPNIVVSTVCDPDRRSAIVERMGQTVFKHSPSGLITLFEKCWDLDPDVRPEFSSVMESLKDILNVMEQSSPWVDLFKHVQHVSSNFSSQKPRLGCISCVKLF